MLNIIFLILISFLCYFFPMSTQAENLLSFTLSENEEHHSSKDNTLIQKLYKSENEKEQTKEKLSPEQTVDSLAAKSSNWQEPSKRSEERYKNAILQWLDNMQPQQRELAYKILKDAHSEMHTLRSAIRDKKRELATLSFNRHTSPEALPRLGQELQNLRKQLRSRLELISKRLRQEAGVTMGPLEGDAFWLQPQDPEPHKPKASNKKHSDDKVNSNNSQKPMFSMNY